MWVYFWALYSIDLCVCFYVSKKWYKDQWIQELVPWKNKQDSKTFKQTHQEKRERTQVNKIRNWRGEITTDAKEIQRIVRKCDVQLYANKPDNMDDMDKVLETYNLPKLTQNKSENSNR